MYAQQFTGHVPASFEAVGIDPATGNEVKGTIKVKLSRLAFKTVTAEGFTEAMQQADRDPSIIGELLAGKTNDDGTTSPGVLVWWEMFEDPENTRMLPITVDNIISMPYDFVIALAEAVISKLFPGPAKAVNLGAGSAPTANTNSAAAETSKVIPMISNGDTTSPERPVFGELPPGNSSQETTAPIG
jgi:hypothetical protein